jgi:2-polyprenyl-3-methyl-5-hydroxy-6-metoxy-1,4-benzoquinol methylase
VAGLDTSGSARDQVKQQFGNTAGFLGVFDQDEVAGSGLRFDVIIVAEVIEHLYDELLDQLLDTLKALSTADTRVIFTTPNEEVLEDAYILCPVSGKLFHRWQHVRTWSKDSVASFLRARNFDVSSVFATHFGLTLDRRGKKNTVKEIWKAIGKNLKYRLRPGRKRPHLVAVVTPAAK